MGRELQAVNHNQRLAEWSKVWRPAETVGRRYHNGAGKTEWLYPRIFYGNGGYRYLSWLMSSAAEMNLGQPENIQLLLP